MRAPVLACLVALAALLAGCAKPAVTDPESPAALGNDTPGAPGPAPAAPSAPATTNGSSNVTVPPPSAGGNATAPANATSAAPPIAWASPDAAKIRPGVQVITASDPRDPTAAPGSARECTSNFVYTSADNATVYLGVAAHCVSGLKIGDPADIGPGIAKGFVAYSSWYVMNNSEIPDDPTSSSACASEKDAGVCDANDFALVRLDPAAVAATSPAVLHFGGPVGLADSSKVQQADKVLTYGNSDLREGIEPYQEKEGYVTEETGWTTYILTQFPGVPGDSGSGVMTADGHALGDLVTVTEFAADPFNPPTASGVTNLDHALAYARDHGGLDVRLATWALLDAGTLPPV